jgi:hypothetical protein
MRDGLRPCSDERTLPSPPRFESFESLLSFEEKKLRLTTEQGKAIERRYGSYAGCKTQLDPTTPKNDILHLVESSSW